MSGIGPQQLGDVKAAAFRDVVTRGDWHERFQLVVRVHAALNPFTPNGRLNDQDRAQAEIAAAIGELSGPD